MMRWIAISLAVMLGAFVIACGPEGDPDGKSQPAKNAGPGQAQQPAPVDPGANQPGPVQGDPSAHDPDPQHIELQAIWESETKALPQIEYSVGGGQIPAPANAMRVVQNKTTGKWSGFWVFSTPAKSGGTYGFTMFGTPSFTNARCVVLHHGQFPAAQEAVRNCAVSYKIP